MAANRWVVPTVLVAVAVALVATVTLVAVASDSGDDTATTEETTASSEPAADDEPDPCVDDDVPHDDDVGAEEGLINESQLPTGTWTDRSTPSCRWSLSSQLLLEIPACATGAGNSEALSIEHTANGRASWLREDGGVRIDDRVEFYPGREKPDAFRALLSGTGVADCYTAAVQQQGEQAPQVNVSKIAVRPYDVGLTPEEVGWEFVTGTEIEFTAERDDRSDPVAVRIVDFGGGGVVGILTLIGEDTADLDELDLPSLVRSAATELRAQFGP